MGTIPVEDLQLLSLGSLKNFEQENVVTVALIRPGYYDAVGNQSSSTNCNRGDNRGPETIDAVASAIRNLKSFHKARKVLLVGHSGCAAIPGVVLGRHPGLVDGAALVACPCNMPEWQAIWGRSFMMSLSPQDYSLKNVGISAEVLADPEADHVNILQKPYCEKLSGSLSIPPPIGSD